MWNDCSTGKKVIRIKIFHDSDPLLLKMLHAIVKCEINLKPSSYALKRGLVSEKNSRIWRTEYFNRSISKEYHWIILKYHIVWGEIVI